MKLGILGTGMIVKDVLTMYHELGVEKTYLFSTKKSKSQALELMKKYHLDKVYTDYDELLQSDVDTIYCALPNHLHYEFSKKALENDKNVIIEKPITANSKELEDLIETGQYKEALQYLNDMDNEQVRYQRLVCLYGLKELQQAKREGMKAKVLAGETYYDVVAIYVSILKDLEEFEEAINIIVEELSMPYIPYQYETVFNAAYDELLLAKQEASFDGVTQKVFNEEDIENILTKKDTNEDLLYMAIEQMEGMNIRRMIVPIRQFIRDNDQPDFAKSLLIELMIDQEIDEDLEVVKKGVHYDINPSYAPMVLNQESGVEIYKLLMDALEDDNPSLLTMCEQFLNFYLYSIYPKYIDEQDYRSIAGAIHYHLASLQYIDIELEDIEYLYNCNQEDVKDVLETIQSIEY